MSVDVSPQRSAPFLRSLEALRHTGDEPADADAQLRQLADEAARTLEVERAQLWLAEPGGTRATCAADSAESLVGSTDGGGDEAAETMLGWITGDAEAGADIVPDGEMWIPIVAAGRRIGALRLVGAADDLIRTDAAGMYAMALAERAAAIVVGVRLRDREVRIAEAQAIARIGNWEWDTIANRITWSAEQLRIHGLDYNTRPETFEAFLERVHPDDQAMVVTACDALLRTGAPFAFAYRVVRPDGTLRWLFARGRMTPDRAGDPTRMIGTAQDITERKAMEDALRISEESYRTIFDLSNDAIFIHDLDTGEVLDANRRACEVVGSTLAELRSNGLALIGDSGPPFTQEKAVEHLRRAAAGEPQRFEWRTHNAEDQEVWSDVQLQRVTIRGVDRLLATVRDIAQWKATEKALRESETSYRTIFQHAADAMWLHDLETGDFLEVNQAACELYGYTVEETMQIGVAGLADGRPGYDVQSAAGFIQRAAAGVPQRFEWLGRHKNGGEVWAEVTLRRVNILGVDRLLATGRDINDRKLAEKAQRRANEELEQRVRERTEALDVANQALRASEEHFRVLIENAHDITCIVDRNGLLRYQSPSLERILGYPPEELIGRSSFDYIHPDDAPRVAAVIQSLVDNPASSVRVEYRFRHRDGGWRHLEAFGRMMSEHSAADGIVANIRDVTDRVEAEAALERAMGDAERAREDAERANRAKSDFLSRMSHELRTPMNSILGFAQVLGRGGLRTDQERSVQHIMRAGEHLLRLINEVLEIARIESGRHSMSIEPVAISGALREVIGLVRPMAAQNGIEILGEPIEIADFVRADRQRLVQVLLNLLSNGIKYNRHGGSVRLSFGRDGEGDDARVWVRIEDTGRGIRPEHIDQLFTPFARLGAELSNVEGTGLGLALSQRMAEAMGGRLFLEGTGPTGSVFRLELQAERAPGEAQQELSKPVGAVDGQTWEPAELLYIEDNLANLTLVETFLEFRPGWRIVPALQGGIGVELARQNPPDLVLLDLHLPDINGEEVLRRLRADERTADIPIIIISADATRTTLARLQAAGADAYLTKPLNMDEFLGTIEHHLERRRGTPTSDD